MVLRIAGGLAAALFCIVFPATDAVSQDAPHARSDSLFRPWDAAPHSGGGLPGTSRGARGGTHSYRGRGRRAALPEDRDPELSERRGLPAHLRRRAIEYATAEPAGTIIVDTANTYLYLVLGNGKAIRYGIGVGREGFTWSGRERISRKAEWPDWRPPPEMLEREPDLPSFVPGGLSNPLGARALYLGNTLYRIHGTNQPSTIGTYMSSGCIRLRNEDVIDLYGRVSVGAQVIVLPGRGGSESVSR